MASIRFSSKLKDDDSLTIPREIIDDLGLHPGDEVRLRIEATNGAADQSYYDQAVAKLLEEARRVKPEPGKPGNDPQEAEFGEIMKEKYRKQGFDL